MFGSASLAGKNKFVIRETKLTNRACADLGFTCTENHSGETTRGVHSLKPLEVTTVIRLMRQESDGQHAGDQ